MQVSIAERLAYGTPLDTPVDSDQVHSVPRPATALVGRILLATLFLVSGFAKLADPAGTIGFMNMAGIPSADTLVYVAAVAEILGGLAVAVGFLARLAGVGLVLLLIPIQFYFHAFWNMEGAEAKTNLVQFTKNLAIMGGLLLLVAHGPGRYSVDSRLRRPLMP
jgi:putative oxidoreductase